MTHDPELLAAEYLDHMPESARGDFEAHLLTCDGCWREICLAREGRELAEDARELAPAGIRDDIRATITASVARQPTDRRRHRTALVLAVVAVVALAGTVLVRTQVQRSLPSSTVVALPRTAVTAAVDGFRDNQLPGTTVPAQSAPDLSRIGLHLVGAGAGHLDGAAVSVFAYRDATGTRLSVYQSSRAFPEDAEAQHLGDGDDAWTMQAGGVSVLCAKGAHSTLLLSSDSALVRQAGAVLNVI